MVRTMFNRALKASSPPQYDGLAVETLISWTFSDYPHCIPLIRQKNAHHLRVAMVKEDNEYQVCMLILDVFCQQPCDPHSSVTVSHPARCFMQLRSNCIVQLCSMVDFYDLSYVLSHSDKGTWKPCLQLQKAIQ